MNLTKDPQTGIYYVPIRTLDGKRKRISTKSRDKQEARKIVNLAGLKEIELAARAGRLTYSTVTQIITGQKLSVDHAFGQWREWAESVSRSPHTLNNYVLILTAWIKDMHLGSLAPIALTEKHIDDWLNQESENKASTRVVQLAAVHNFFKFCSIRKWVLGDPSRLVSIKRNLLTHAQKEPRRRQIFTDVEIGRLLKTTHPNTGALPFWFCAIALGRYTGLRLGDICTLEWGCFSDPGMMKVWTDKSDTAVLLPLNDPPVLAEAVGAIPYSDPVYCFPEQAALVKDVKRRALLSVQFARLCKALDIGGKSFHCLRHTYATEARRLGKTMAHISEDLGHHGIEITRGYIHED